MYRMLHKTIAHEGRIDSNGVMFVKDSITLPVVPVAVIFENQPFQQMGLARDFSTNKYGSIRACIEIDEKFAAPGIYWLPTAVIQIEVMRFKNNFEKFVEKAYITAVNLQPQLIGPLELDFDYKEENNA